MMTVANPAHTYLLSQIAERVTLFRTLLRNALKENDFLEPTAEYVRNALATIPPGMLAAADTVFHPIYIDARLDLAALCVASRAPSISRSLTSPLPPDSRYLQHPAFPNAATASHWILASNGEENAGAHPGSLLRALSRSVTLAPLNVREGLSFALQYQRAVWDDGENSYHAMDLAGSTHVRDPTAIAYLFPKGKNYMLDHGPATAASPHFGIATKKLAFDPPPVGIH